MPVIYDRVARLGADPSVARFVPISRVVEFLGKEPALRLPSFSRVSPKIALAAAVAVAMVSGGCETKSWLNPGEVGRFNHEPLLLPIVNSLSGETGIEEPNDEFAQASDVSAEDLQSANQDYVIGKNDLLSISISDLVGPGVETVKQARVSESEIGR